MAEFVFRTHALRRMFERQITPVEIRLVVERGRTIEERADDSPYPSRLVLGFVGKRALHVVVAEDRDAGTVIVVTVYEPDPGEWLPGFMRRRA